MRQKAPWPDFDGNQIVEGDRVVLPCGESGVVVCRVPGSLAAEDWCVDYGGGDLKGLAGEVSKTGRAVMLDETGKSQ